MPAKWQKWMPLDLDQLWSSPSVQRMSCAAFKGYIGLLTAQWQSENGSIPADMHELAEKSRLNDEEWEANSASILRKFVSIEGSRLRNEVCFQKWLDAKTVFEARQASAKRTNTVTARSPHGHRTMRARSPERSADTRTDTETVTKTEKQKPSGEKPPAEKSIHAKCMVLVHGYWQAFHPGSPAAPWGAAEGKQLQTLLSANPLLDEAEVKRLLEHRARSDVNHSQRPCEWLAKLTNFTGGPLDQFGNPKGGSYGADQTGTGGSKPTSPATARVASGVGAFRQAASKFGIEGTGGADGADDRPVSPPGHGGGSGKLPLRLQPPDGEARAAGSQDSFTEFAHKAGAEILPHAR